MTIEQEIAKAVRENPSLDVYRAMAKMIDGQCAGYTDLYSHIRESIRDERMTEEEAYWLFICAVRNAMTCLKRIERLITKRMDADAVAEHGQIAALRAENDMLKDTMIRACVWLDVHGRPGIPDVTRTLSEAVAATVKKEAHNEPRT